MIIPVLAVMLSSWNRIADSGEVSISFVSFEMASTEADSRPSPPADSEVTPGEAAGGTDKVRFLISLPRLDLPMRMKLLFIGLMLVSASALVYPLGAPAEIRTLPGTEGTPCVGRAEWCWSMLQQIKGDSPDADSMEARREVLSQLYHPDPPHRYSRISDAQEPVSWIFSRWNTFDVSRATLRWLSLVFFTLGIVLFGGATVFTIIKTVIN
ncbi:MAG: hypothetical protein AAFQ31_05630 [Planctomycetota bacterium]